MAVTPKTLNYTVGRGEVHLAAFDNPVAKNPQGFRYIGNNPSFSLTSTSTDLDHFNSDHGIGELDFSIPTQVTRNAAFTTDNVDLDNLALTFLGTKLTSTFTPATGLTETFPAIVQGLTYQLGMSASTPYGRRNVTAVVVKVGATTAVPVTDYLVDLARGEIIVNPGSTVLANGASMVVTYNQAAGSIDQVISGKTPFEGAVKFVADNLAGINNDYFMPWVRITPNGDFNLKADNAGALQVLSYNMKVLKRPDRAAFYINGQAYT